MIDCPNGTSIEISTEGQKATKEIITLCILRRDGTYFIRSLDGAEWITPPNTAVRELRKEFR